MASGMLRQPRVLPSLHTVAHRNRNAHHLLRLWHQQQQRLQLSLPSMVPSHSSFYTRLGSTAPTHPHPQGATFSHPSTHSCLARTHAPHTPSPPRPCASAASLYCTGVQLNVHKDEKRPRAALISATAPHTLATGGKPQERLRGLLCLLSCLSASERKQQQQQQQRPEGPMQRGSVSQCCGSRVSELWASWVKAVPAPPAAAGPRTCQTFACPTPFCGQAGRRSRPALAPGLLWAAAPQHTTALRRTVQTWAVGKSGSKASSKTKTVYVCQDCGEDHIQWYGVCRSCGHSGTLKRLSLPKDGATGNAGGSGGGGGGAGVRAAEKFNQVQPQQWQRDRPSLAHKSFPSDGERREDGMEQYGDREGEGAGLGRGARITHAGFSLWGVGSGGARPRRLTEVGNGDGATRLKLEGQCGSEMARVLGGGVVPGSLVLVGGEPGVGKSTLLLQLAGLLAEASLQSSGSEDVSRRDQKHPVLYISGEETEEQVASRARRMGVTADNLFLFASANLEEVLEHMYTMAPRAVVVDSIQTVYLSDATGSTGSVSQVRECATALLQAAKRSGIPVFIVGHVTKSGEIAGPRVLEHIVDVVLYMEGESVRAHRILRCTKNRHGTVDEIAVFEMAQAGLLPVANLSSVFLSSGSGGGPGGCASVAVTLQGSRPLLLEVQALCTPAREPPGRRMVNGVDSQRLSLLLAVLLKRLNLKTHAKDLFLNVVGGMHMKEPAADLAIAIAIISSVINRPVPPDMAFIGEVGLHGELRPVGQVHRRVSEATRLGFRRCIVPAIGFQGASSLSPLPPSSLSLSPSSASSSDSSASPSLPTSTRASIAIPCHNLVDAVREALGDTIPPQRQHQPSSRRVPSLDIGVDEGNHNIVYNFHGDDANEDVA